MNSDTSDARAFEFPQTVAKVLTSTPQNDKAVDLKLELNNLLWMHAKKETTIEDADRAACVAFNAIWPLCEQEY